MLALHCNQLFAPAGKPTRIWCQFKIQNDHKCLRIHPRSTHMTHKCFYIQAGPKSNGGSLAYCKGNDETIRCGLGRGGVVVVVVTPHFENRRCSRWAGGLSQVRVRSSPRAHLASMNFCATLCVDVPDK